MYNKITLLGYVGIIKDLQFTSSGAAILHFQLATKYKYNKNSKDITSWHDVVLFGKFAQVFADLLKPKQIVFCEGRMGYSQYEADGVKHSRAQVFAEIIRIINSKVEGSSDTEVAPTYKDIQGAPPADKLTDDDIPF